MKKNIIDLLNLREYGFKHSGIEDDSRELEEISNDELIVSMKWILKNTEKEKNINKKSGTSYELKHKVEEECGYITNGAFILAAISLGYDFIQVEEDNPNAYFNIKIKNQK